MDLHQWFDNRRKSSSFVEENDYSASFDSGANNWLAFWLYFVASSYFLLKENVNFFSGSRIKSQENVSLCNKSIPNERMINGATVVDDVVSYSESLGSPRSTCSSIYFDAYSEISDFDRTSYCHSLLSLEEEDSELLSDSMIPQKPSSPLSYSSDSFTRFSNVDTPSYWDSLLKLEEEDKEWNLDKEKESYKHSLLSLEDEDSEWLLDSVTSKNLSSPLSFGGDSFTDISDVGTQSYWDSLLRLDEEENSEHLLETADIEEFNSDEPLYWPFEGKFDWESKESSFCNSPRKRLVFDSNMDSPLEYFALDQEFAIETLVGLKEFDGHEGLAYEFIDDGFMLEEFLE